MIPCGSIGSQPSIDLDQWEGRSLGEMGKFPASSSLPWTHSKAQFVLAGLLEEVPHAKQTNLPITCCHVAACGEAVAPSEASLCILLPLSWSHFPLFLPLAAMGLHLPKSICS